MNIYRMEELFSLNLHKRRGGGDGVIAFACRGRLISVWRELSSKFEDKLEDRVEEDWRIWKTF